MATAIDSNPDHANTITGKSFWRWDTTTSYDSAKGVCLGYHWQQGGQVGGQQH